MIRNLETNLYFKHNLKKTEKATTRRSFTGRTEINNETWNITIRLFHYSSFTNLIGSSELFFFVKTNETFVFRNVRSAFCSLPKGAYENYKYKNIIFYI